MIYPPCPSGLLSGKRFCKLTKLLSAAGAALFIATLTGLLPRQAVAVTVAECLDQSHNPTAARICQELIDNGNRTAAVYLRLAQALNVTGKRSESYQSIEEGLKAYPGHAGLIELKAIVRSNLSEQEYLDAQARKGPSKKAANKAKLRILRIKCLKKSGREALEACDEFVALGGENDEIDQQRESLLASLPAPPKPPAPTDTAKVPPPPEEPKSARVIDITPTPTPAPVPPEVAEITENPQQVKDREAYARQLAVVRKIQAELNALGYQAGIPDGLPGLKTRTAIERFYADTAIGPQQSIGQSLLDDLERAQRIRSEALALYEQSRAALTGGDATTANDLFNSAQQLASWVAPTDDLAGQIANGLASQQRQETARLAEVEQKRQQQIQADEEIKRRDAARQTARKLMASAEIAMDNGDLEKAGALLKQAGTADASLNIRKLDDQLRTAMEERNRLALAQQQQTEKDRVRKEATSLLTRARAALGNDQLEQARQLTRQARALDSSLEDADLVAAEITRRQREIDDDAKKAAKTRQNQQESTITTLLGNAKSELAANNPTAARAIAEEILVLQPGNVEAMNIINGQTDERADSGQRLAELLERGEILQKARKSRHSKEPDYFIEHLPTSIGRLFGE